MPDDAALPPALAPFRPFFSTRSLVLDTEINGVWQLDSTLQGGLNLGVPYAVANGPIFKTPCLRTPITVNGCPFTMAPLPTTCGSPPKREFHTS